MWPARSRLTARFLVRLATVAAAALITVLVPPASPALAHAQLIVTTPAAGEHLVRAPGEVTLRFSEQVRPVRGAVRLLDSAGRDVGQAQPQVPAGQPDEVRLALPANLPDGGYLVTWRVVSVDAHPVAGSFSFTVGTGGAAPPSAPDTAPSSGLTVGFWLARGLDYAALSLFGGGLLFLLLCWPAWRSDTRARRLVGAGWLIGLVATGVALLLQGLDVSGQSSSHVFGADVIGATAASGYGRLGVARMVLFVLGGVVLSRLSRSAGDAGRAAKLGVVALVVALCATWAGSGHAVAGRAAVLGAVADTVHLTAMAVWLGGLVLLFACVLPRRREGVPAEVISIVGRFSRLAMIAVGALVVTGVFQAWRVLGTNPFNGGEYTQILVFKLAAFGLLLCLAAASRSVLRHRYGQVGGPDRPAPGAVQPAVSGRAGRRRQGSQRRHELAAAALLRRSVVIELVIGAAVLGLTAGLVSTAPGGHSGVGQPVAGPYHGPVTELLRLTDGTQVQVWIDPARTGQNQVVADVRDSAGAARDVPEVRAELSQPALGVDGLAVAFSRDGPGQFVADNVQVPVAGQWRLVVWVRTTDIDEMSAATTISLV